MITSAELGNEMVIDGDRAELVDQHGGVGHLRAGGR